ncbi:MAG: TRAP transporter small permease subunit, partial [Pseudomonadota bacterium]
IEGFSNTIGRFAAWVGLIMVLQQVMVVFLQRIFLVAQIDIAPFGVSFSRDLSWWTEELKLYNAIIVTLCCAYTFVQGGHVRVDLFYAGVSHRTKRVVDMFGSLFFILPTMVITWLFGWFFLWRHLVTPKVNTTDKIETVLRKTKLMKWNVETIGFSPSGFDAYFLFKVLLVAFAGMMFLAGCAYFYRALLEYLEGEESAGKYLDKDSLEDDVAEQAAEIH